MVPCRISKCQYIGAMTARAHANISIRLRCSLQNSAKVIDKLRVGRLLLSSSAIVLHYAGEGTDIHLASLLARANVFAGVCVDTGIPPVLCRSALV